MMLIRCSKCKGKIFKYIKIGKGKVLYCWKDRIIEDFSIQEGNQIKCNCGNIIGLNEEKGVKLKQHSIIVSGTKN